MIVKCVKCNLTTYPSWTEGSLYQAELIRTGKNGRRVVGIFSDQEIESTGYDNLFAAGTQPWSLYEYEGFLYLNQNDPEQLFVVLE